MKLKDKQGSPATETKRQERRSFISKVALGGAAVALVRPGIANAQSCESTLAVTQYGSQTEVKIFLTQAQVECLAIHGYEGSGILTLVLENFEHLNDPMFVSSGGGEDPWPPT